MVTYAEDNPYPSVLFEETEAVDLAANPGVGQRRLIVDPSDHLLYLVDSSGTATVVGGGLTDPMTSRGDVIIRNASNVTARLAKGSADTYLGSDGTDVSYSAVTDAKLSTSDITTNNASTSKHGFLKKLSNSATDYMDGTGAWSTPAGGGGSGAPLGHVHYAAGSDQNYTVGGTLADVDATNILVTFTAPASGNVFIYCAAMVQNNGGFGLFGVRESTTDIVAGQMVTNAASPTMGLRTFYLSGISAGSHTYKLSGKNILIYHGPNYGKVEMIIWAAA